MENNAAAQELINTYGLLANTDFTYDKDGIISLTSEGQNKITSQAQQRAASAQLYSAQANYTSNSIINEKSAKEIANALEHNNDLSNVINDRNNVLQTQIDNLKSADNDRERVQALNSIIQEAGKLGIDLGDTQVDIINLAQAIQSNTEVLKQATNIYAKTLLNDNSEYNNASDIDKRIYENVVANLGQYANEKKYNFTGNSKADEAQRQNISQEEKLRLGEVLGDVSKGITGVDVDSNFGGTAQKVTIHYADGSKEVVEEANDAFTDLLNTVALTDEQISILVDSTKT